MDCGNQLLRDIDIRFYPRPMAKGKALYQVLGDGVFQAWPAGSLNEILHTVLCR